MISIIEDIAVYYWDAETLSIALAITGSFHIMFNLVAEDHQFMIFVVHSFVVTESQTDFQIVIVGSQSKYHIIYKIQYIP